MSVTVARKSRLTGSGDEKYTLATLVARRWRANLELDFEKRKQRTVLVRRRHQGPLCVQKPFYPEGDEICHTYLLHPPAGIVGGDRLNIEVSLQKHSHALITTPAATRFYRANPYAGILSHSISLQAHSTLEWLPQENILFNGAKAKIRTKIQLQKDSRLLAWDSQCLGRPACDEVFEQGHCQQRFEIWLGGQPLFIDALCLDAGSNLQTAKWGLAGSAINSVLVAYPASTELLSLIKCIFSSANGASMYHFSEIKSQSGVQCAASLMDSLLVVRCLGKDMELVQTMMRGLWQVMRPHILGREACYPRVWNT